MSQHKSTLRRSLRSALRHKTLADSILDDILGIQTQFNLAMDKIDADNTAAMDTDYVATLAITASEYDAESTGVQHKADLRKCLRSALSHKKLADEVIDSIEELQVTFNALMAKIDAEAGTLNDIDYASTLAVVPFDPDTETDEAQHKAFFRKSLRSALSHRRLADQILDAINTVQDAVNLALAQLDVDAGAGTGALTGLYTPFKVTAVDPDAE